MTYDLILLFGYQNGTKYSTKLYFKPNLKAFHLTLRQGAKLHF